MKPNQLVVDVECYINYFLIYFKAHNGKGKYFEIYDGHPLDVEGVLSILNKFEIVTFNGKNYDLPMITLALTGATTQELKKASDKIIKENLRFWQFYKQLDMYEPKWKHVDLIEPAPSVKTSLKIYGGRMHSKRMQDLPIEPDAVITPEQRVELVKYCRNDLDTTEDLSNAIENRLQLRRDMSKQYGIDLMSKSDAQIAEAVIKSEVEKITKEQIVKRKVLRQVFRYEPPKFIKFKTPKLQAIFDQICETDYIAEPNGGYSVENGVRDIEFRLGDSYYKVGIGGLHSQESERSNEADENTLLIDADVASYYPTLILQMQMYPESIGPHFLTVFKNITETRLKAKKEKNKLVADSMKIMINGTFGKLGSVYSIFYAPKLLLQTTLTGQLSLLMLIEMMELYGIPVISANTDGIVMKCPKEKEEGLKKIVSAWEKHTGLDMEYTYYKGLYNRDVNNYIAIKTNGEVKAKGAFGEPGLMKNPSNAICSEAVINYLKDGIPFEDTIRPCKDIRKFLTVRAVTGGAVKYKVDRVVIKSPTKKQQVDVLTENGWYEVDKNLWTHETRVEDPVGYKEAYKIHLENLPDEHEYLGKAIRWYYAEGVTGTINYKTSGNNVPRSEGAKPCMELPEKLPNDIDYDWYVNECHDLLMDLGVVRRPHPERMPREGTKRWLDYVKKGDIIPDPHNEDGYVWAW